MAGHRHRPAPPAARRSAAVCAIAAMGVPVCHALCAALASRLLAALSGIPGASLIDPVGAEQTAALLLWGGVSALALILPGAWAVRALDGVPAQPGVRWSTRLGLCIPRGLPSSFAPVFLGLSMLAGTAGSVLERALAAPPRQTLLPEGGGALFASLLVLCVLPALTEELFFRGVLRAALHPFEPKAAVWGTALLFALAHGSVSQCITALISGLLLGLCAESCGSIWPGAALHLCNNLLAFAASWLSQYADGEVSSLFSLAVGLLTAVWAAAALRKRDAHGQRSGIFPRVKRDAPGAAGTRALLENSAFRAALVCLGLRMLWRCLQG